jgi:hypothetical protein
MSVTNADIVGKIAEQINRQEYDTALQQLNRLTWTDIPESELSEAYFVHARCLFHLGNQGDALTILESALDLSKGSTDHLLYARQFRRSKPLKGRPVCCC